MPEAHGIFGDWIVIEICIAESQFFGRVKHNLQHSLQLSFNFAKRTACAKAREKDSVNESRDAG